MVFESFLPKTVVFESLTLKFTFPLQSLAQLASGTVSPAALFTNLET
jgi:hypothetical protein